MTEPYMRRQRLRNQLLADESRASSAAAVVRQLGVMQAQEWPSAQLAIAARSHGVTSAAVSREREVERSFVLTWCLRGTLHLAPSEDARWLLNLLGERAIRSSKRRYEQLGLSESIREQALSHLREILAGGQALTRPQLAARLGERGIPVAGQAIYHLLRFAALRAVICCGPERDGEMTYALLDQWLADKPQVKPSVPSAELARRYRRAYAPAEADDFARWSGLSAGQARKAWTIVEAEGGQATADALSDKPSVRLLPRYDNYMLGYIKRDFQVAPGQIKQVYPGGGLIRACVTVDGIAKANWSLKQRGSSARLTVYAVRSIYPGGNPGSRSGNRGAGRFPRQGGCVADGNMRLRQAPQNIILGLEIARH